MPELLENKSERLQARPTLLHSSTMVGHRVGFAPTPHCEPGAERTRGVETGREQGSRVLISLDQKMTFPWGIFLTFWNACFFFFLVEVVHFSVLISILHLPAARTRSRTVLLLLHVLPHY